MSHCFIHYCKGSMIDRCHIISRGAGGSDEDWNILKMCRQHHRLQHDMGWRRFSIKFPEISRELKHRRFEICPIRNKWIMPRKEIEKKVEERKDAEIVEFVPEEIILLEEWEERLDRS